MSRLRIVQLLFLSYLFFSCGDPMGLKSLPNQNLDTRIALCLSQFSDSTSPKGIYARRIHYETQKLVSTINLFDACRWEMAQANALFKRQARDRGLDKTLFIDLDTLGTKAKIIIAIKRNELVLLDHALSMK